MNTTQNKPVLATISGQVVLEPRFTGSILPQCATSVCRNLRDILSLFVDIFELRSWGRVDPLQGFLLAGFAASIAQPLVYGTLGNSIVALMTPVK